MNAFDEERIVALALRIAHGRDSMSHSPLGNLVAMWLEARLGKTDDPLEVGRWARQHPEAASALITILEHVERSHPESRELQVRQLLFACKHEPHVVNKAAAELKRRMK